MTRNELLNVIKLKQALYDEIQTRLRMMQHRPYFEVRVEARALERRAQTLLDELEQDNEVARLTA
jgi:hypothetical protein